MATAAQKRQRNQAAAAPPQHGKGWSSRRAGGTEILTANILAAIPWLVHGFSTRPGGVSKLSDARVLNLGFTDWDSRTAVSRNRASLLRTLRSEEMPLLALRQIHSALARVVASPSARPLAGDAVITQTPNLLLAIQSADCVPVLLVDTKRRVVGGVHAGWRGTLARVVQKTLGRMRFEFGTRPADVLAALGPAIGGCCYEVGSEVAQAFLGQFVHAAEWFDGPFERLCVSESPDFLPWLTMMPPGHAPPPERVQLDLRVANRWQLMDAGVRAGNIAVSPHCTACRTDLFFSYRREGAHTGRMLAAVGIRG
jgi:YfiH family protein